MATVTVYYLNATATSPNWFGKVQDNGSAPAGALGTGWTVGKTAVSTPYFRGRFGATTLATAAQASSYIDSTSAPTQGTGSTNTTAGDSFRSDNPLSGTFAAGNWNFTFGMRTSTVTTVGRVRLHVWASVNASGASARKLNTAAGTLIGTIVTMSSTTTTYNSTVTWAAPQVVLANEYVFTQIEWQETTQGTANGCTAQFYQASFVTPNYVYDPATGTLARTETADDATMDGSISATGALATTEIADDATADGTVGIEYLRPDGDTVLGGWTDQADGTSNIYQSIDEASASDIDYVQSPEGASTSDLKVRLFESSTQIAEWTHTGVAETYTDAAQTLTAPQMAAITNYANLFVELDDNQGNVYRSQLSNPGAGVAAPAILKYRYKKIAASAGVTYLHKDAPAWVTGGFGSAPPFTSVPINNTSTSDIIIVHLTCSYTGGPLKVTITDSDSVVRSMTLVMGSNANNAVSIWKYTGKIFATPTIRVVGSSVQYVGIAVGVLTNAYYVETGYASAPLQAYNDPSGTNVHLATTTPLTVPTDGIGLIEVSAGNGPAGFAWLTGVQDSRTYETISGPGDSQLGTGHLAATGTPEVIFPTNNYAGMNAVAFKSPSSWTPAHASTPAHVWFDASNAMTVTATGGLTTGNPVTLWKDLGTAGQDYTPDTQAPLYVANAINGKPGISLEGGGQLRTGYAVTLPQPFMSVFIWKQSATAPAAYAILWQGERDYGNPRAIIFTRQTDNANNYAIYCQGGTVIPQGVVIPANGGPYNSRTIWDGAFSVSVLNASTLTGINPGTGGIYTGHVIGTADPITYPHAIVSEFFVIPYADHAAVAANSPTDIANIAAYTMPKWGI